MASTETIGEFLIKLGLDADNIDKQLNNVIGNVKSGLSNLMTGVVAPAFAGLVSGELVQQFADDITQVDKLSKSLGVSVEQLSAWRTAAEMAGVEADEVGEIFADFNDWMVDAKFNEGGAMYTDFIEKGLLPAVTDANGEMKKTEDYILEFADALHKMDPAQASGIARQIGLSDLKTASWIQSGGDAIRRQLELAKEIGTYTQEDAAAASEFTMSIKVLTHSIRMMLLPVFRALVPILTNVSKMFTEVSKHAVALIPILSGIGIAMGVRMAGGFLAIAKSIQKATLAARAFIFSPWGAVLMALLAIGLVLDDFLVWLDGGESAWGEYYESIFGDTENAKQVLQGFYDTVVGVFTSIGGVVDELSPHFEKLWQALVKLFDTVVGSAGFSMFTDLLVDAIGLIIDVIASLIDFIASNAGVITDIISGIIDVITSIVDVVTFVVTTVNTLFTAMGATIQQIGNVIMMIFNAITGAFNSFVSAVSAGASSIISWISSILSKLAELASNSIFGKIIGAVGGSVSALFSGGGAGNTDNSSNSYVVNNYGSAANSAAAAMALPSWQYGGKSY